MRQGTPLLLGMGCSWTHVYTDLFITAASNHLCYFHHPTIRASNHECCFRKRQAQQFQFLPVHMCSYTRGLSKSPEQNKDLKVIQHSLCTRNQTRLIAQGRHLSGTSCHCFLWLLLMDLFYSKFSSWLAHFLLNYLTLNWIFCSFWREFLVWTHLSNLSLL